MTVAERTRMRVNAQMSLEMPELASPQVALADWDVILLNTSGGKDSQTMIAEVIRQADAAGVARSHLVAVHANLGRVEWPGTPELARQQAEAYGIEFREVSRPQGDLLDHVEQRGMWPSPAARYCTSDHKRGQVAKVITALDRERRTGSTFRILNCMGLRAAESPARARKDAHAPNRYFSTKTRTVWDWLPIQDWSDAEVWEDIEASGVPHHGAYDLGMPRLSCAFCIYAPMEALMLAGRHNPDLLAEYVAVERRIDHTFRPELSMADIAAAVADGEGEAAAIDSWRM